MPENTVVYLDSNDYSSLSEINLNETQTGLRSKLLSLRNASDLMFTFSGAHISEMSPLDQLHASAAIRRTTLLADLCKRNAMISFDRLMKAELENLVARKSERVAAIDTNGQWFPELGNLISPLDELDIAGTVRKQSEEEGLNRKSRRMLKSTMINKQGGFRSNVEKLGGEVDLKDLISRVPMRPCDVRVLKKYVLGTASRDEADAAFLESLRDPSFMVQWFTAHHDRLGAIGNWVRNPSQNLLDTMEFHLAILRRRLAAMPEEESAAALSSFNGAYWTKAQNQGVLDIVNRLILDLLPGESECNDLALINEYCPGISTFLRTLYSSVRNSFGKNPRAMSKSDFVDALHAMYVPYVSYFRADRYMAPIIRPHAQRFGTQVFGGVGELLTALESRHLK
ncbi:hypothetical protein [Pseudomonas cucumis]|uniref:hypothetical protein n=1 Tax=Pseudomonas cucumis TaxID=2954082 RepID=UPI0027349465|nr:hypothetical protein [Pseudomonas cucumis]WLG92527.1 hypothetical protein PSH72_10785 [Pseudomonas cucumis]